MWSVTEPRPEGSDTSRSAGSAFCARGDASSRSRLGFRRHKKRGRTRRPSPRTTTIVQDLARFIPPMFSPFQQELPPTGVTRIGLSSRASWRRSSCLWGNSCSPTGGVQNPLDQLLVIDPRGSGRLREIFFPGERRIRIGLDNHNLAGGGKPDVNPA
jgi:hypothetical protein